MHDKNLILDVYPYNGLILKKLKKCWPIGRIDYARIKDNWYVLIHYMIMHGTKIIDMSWFMT